MTIFTTLFLSCSSNMPQKHKINYNCDISVYIIKPIHYKNYYPKKVIDSKYRLLSNNDFTSLITRKVNGTLFVYAEIDKTLQSNSLTTLNANLGNWLIVRINNQDTVIEQINEHKEILKEIYIWDDTKVNLIPKEVLINSR